jgi:hypothetical protein
LPRFVVQTKLNVESENMTAQARAKPDSHGHDNSKRMTATTTHAIAAAANPIGT